MEPVKRMIVNTSAQYVKSLVNIVLSLYSTRIVLEALEISDYGLYSVVGGLVAMLGFMTNALVITTQRYMSYYYHENVAYVKKLFVNSLFLHLLIGGGLSLVLLLPQDWLVNNVLNIPADRIQAAVYVYGITIFMLFVTIVTAPFKALFIARENIVYISVVEVCDGILKLLLAFCLLGVTVDKLLFYAGMMALIILVNFFAFAIYSLLHYEECTIKIRRCDIEKDSLRRLMGFAGWTTYGMGAVAARNQGTAVILNCFFGTVINAAYGIAFQVQSAVSFVATSIYNAMNPQIMKAEGAGEREKASFLAARESKYSAILMSVVIVPLIMEMPSVLDWWLKDVPEGSVLFCRSILVAFLCDQMTYGLHTLNQALGNIRVYTLMVYTPKLLTLPLIWLLLRHGADVWTAMCVYVGIELLVAVFRLPYLKYTAGICVWRYLKKVIAPLLFLCGILVSVGYLCMFLGFGFWTSLFVMSVSGVLLVWFVILDEGERSSLSSFIKVKEWVAR